MTPLPSSSAQFTPSRATERRPGCEVRLRLLPTGDGWSLVAPDGRLIFHARGTRGRRHCLEAARASGALTIL